MESILLLVLGVAMTYASVRHVRPPLRVLGVIIGVGLILAGFMPHPPLGKMRELARRTQCQSNLLSWHLALAASTYPPAITYPEHLWDANPDDVSPELMICPGAAYEYGMPEVALTMTNICDYCDYIYVSGLAPNQHEDLPVMICPPENHRGKGANVLFNSGSTLWVPAEEFEKLIAWTYGCAESNGLGIVASKAVTDRSEGRYRSLWGWRGKTKALVSPSATGWNLKPGSPEEGSRLPTTIVINPAGEEFDIGETAYPDFLAATLWIVSVEELNARFLLIRVPPAASGAIPMPILFIDQDDRPTLAGSIRQRWEFSVHPEDKPDSEPRVMWDGEHRLRDMLFKDIDNDGVPELEEYDIWKSGGTVTYFSFGEDKQFIPILVETWKPDEDQKMQLTSREDKRP